jgi:hypothetical protein
MMALDQWLINVGHSSSHKPNACYLSQALVQGANHRSSPSMLDLLVLKQTVRTAITPPNLNLGIRCSSAVSSFSRLPRGPTPDKPTSSILSTGLHGRHRCLYYRSLSSKEYAGVLPAPTFPPSVYVNSVPPSEEDVPWNVFFRFNVPASLNRTTP